MLDRPSPSGRGRGVVIGLILGLALAWLVSGRNGSFVHAQTQQGQPVSSSDTPTLSWTVPLSEGSQLLYIVDTRTQAFAVYRVDTREPRGAVKLEAARQYRWDLKLAEFNNQAPEVATIESMVGAPKR